MTNYYFIPSHTSYFGREWYLITPNKMEKNISDFLKN